MSLARPTESSTVLDTRPEPTHPWMVRRRRVVHVAGFDPASPERLAHHMRSGLRRFAPVWGAQATASEPKLSADERAMDWDVTVRGPNWVTETQYTVLRWDELMEPYVARPWLTRVLGGFAALLGFVRDGMIIRYFRANLRYGLFVIYPFLLLLLFVGPAIAAGIIAADLGIPGAVVTAPLVGVAFYAILFRLIGSYFHIEFALSDWQFARDLVKQRVAGLGPCLERFSAIVVAAARDTKVDEVLLSATSLGAVMLVEALAKALSTDPNLCRRAPNIAMLTVGSSILKIGLHPGAKRLRDSVGIVGRERSLFWVEYQSKIDFINFYKTDPVEMLTGRTTGRPKVIMTRIRGMMSESAYRWKRLNLLHIHRQFVLPNARRYHYDFYQICFGPLSLAGRVAIEPQAPRLFEKDGTFRPGAVKARSVKSRTRTK